MTAVTNPPTQAAHDWSSEALLAKAQRYIEEMLSHPRDDWRFVFWSTLTLELLSRASLAHVSPTLLADEHDWHNLYFALGHIPTKQKFRPKSVDTGEVLRRLQEVLPSFTPELHGIAAAHLERRNQELHTGGTPLDGIGTSKWLTDFYRVCEALLSSMGEDLKVFLGADEAEVASHMLAAAKDETAKVVGKSVQAHKLVWDSKAADEQQQLLHQASAWATKHEGHRVACPSCGSDAIVTGAPAAPPLRKLKSDTIIETQQFLPAKFECIACGLKIGGLSQLIAAELGDSYTATYEYDAAEYYAPEDRYGDYEPDFNEP